MPSYHTSLSKRRYKTRRVRTRRSSSDRKRKTRNVRTRRSSSDRKRKTRNVRTRRSSGDRKRKTRHVRSTSSRRTKGGSPDPVIGQYRGAVIEHQLLQQTHNAALGEGFVGQNLAAGGQTAATMTSGIQTGGGGSNVGKRIGGTHKITFKDYATNQVLGSPLVVNEMLSIDSLLTHIYENYTDYTPVQRIHTTISLPQYNSTRISGAITKFLTTEDRNSTAMTASNSAELVCQLRKWDNVEDILTSYEDYFKPLSSDDTALKPSITRENIYNKVGFVFKLGYSFRGIFPHVLQDIIKDFAENSYPKMGFRLQPDHMLSMPIVKFNNGVFFSCIPSGTNYPLTTPITPPLAAPRATPLAARNTHDQISLSQKYRLKRELHTKTTTITVATFNIENGVGLRNVEDSTSTKKSTEDAPDVICLQEVYDSRISDNRYGNSTFNRSILKNIVTLLKTKYSHVDDSYSCCNAHTNMILYNTTRVSLINSKLCLRNNHCGNKLVGTTVPPKSTLFATFRKIAGNRSFVVGCVHLAACQAYVLRNNTEEWENIKTYITSNYNNKPLIICGDFNRPPTELQIKEMHLVENNKTTHFPARFKSFKDNRDRAGKTALRMLYKSAFPQCGSVIDGIFYRHPFKELRNTTTTIQMDGISDHDMLQTTLFLGHV